MERYRLQLQLGRYEIQFRDPDKPPISPPVSPKTVPARPADVLPASRTSDNTLLDLLQRSDSAARRDSAKPSPSQVDEDADSRTKKDFFEDEIARFPWRVRHY